MFYRVARRKAEETFRLRLLSDNVVCWNSISGRTQIAFEMLIPKAADYGDTLLLQICYNPFFDWRSRLNRESYHSDGDGFRSGCCALGVCEVIVDSEESVP